MGFYELKDMNLPAVPWREYTGSEILDPNILWTIRSAVFRGNDLNLPRLVGINASKATEFANNLLSKMKDKGMVIYYPYFLANKSGTLNVYREKVIIEAVRKDLWNLVTYSDREVTIEIEQGKKNVYGNNNFLSENEISILLSNVADVKRTFRDDLLEGKSVLLEWSFAQQSDLMKRPTGEEFLVFYEVRTIE